MSIAYGPKKIINNGLAAVAHLSSNSADTYCFGRACDVALYNVVSIQAIWSSLTGTLDGTLTIEVSDDGTNWDTKKISGSDAVITPSSANGNDTLSISDSTERYYRANWVANGITGGRINCMIIAKGS